jgi:hypothetical protein
LPLIALKHLFEPIQIYAFLLYCKRDKTNHVKTQIPGEAQSNYGQYKSEMLRFA